MVMIVKDHEKKAHGFISVTRYGCYPGSPADSEIRYGAGAPEVGLAGGQESACGGGRGPLAAAPVGAQGPHACLRLALL